MKSASEPTPGMQRPESLKTDQGCGLGDLQAFGPEVWQLVTSWTRHRPAMARCTPR